MWTLWLAVALADEPEGVQPPSAAPSEQLKEVPGLGADAPAMGPTPWDVPLYLPAPRKTPVNPWVVGTITVFGAPLAIAGAALLTAQLGATLDPYAPPPRP